MTVEQAEAHDELRKTIAKQDALIKQMGEALIGFVAVADRKTDEFDRAHAALKSYNNWKRERGE